MSKCKNCIHNSVCKYTSENYNCNNFEDLSNVIKLPCKVGDVVYSIKNNHINECNVIWIKIESIVSITIRLMTSDYIFYDIKSTDFNKTVFTTKSVAKQMLDKRNK